MISAYANGMDPNGSGPCVTAGPEVVISNVEGQVIEGFGGAFTESSATVYKTTGGGTGGCWI